jgi:D-serine deaminase-like pyridoxal phosphate-dependent protein
MSYAPKPGMPVEEIDTPALILDLDDLEYNLRTMSRFFAGKKVSLRPHSKTHKCPQIARLQLEAGAIGITCAKLGEAEVMARAGIQNILIANQVSGAVKLGRLVDLARICNLMVAVDDIEGVRQLGEACRAAGVKVSVLIEVNIGMGRCGVEPGEPTLKLARFIQGQKALQFKGLMGYEGHLVMIPDLTERTAKVTAAFGLLKSTKELLESHGLAVEIVSGGGTGTFDITAGCEPVTEIQAGSYVFMDATYAAIRPEFRVSLTMLTSVVSRPEPGHLALDAGLKTISREFGLPAPIGLPGATVRYLSEEHLVVDLADPAAVSLKAGDKVFVMPTHCCTTTNLHNTLHVVRAGRLVDLWPIAARGCSQ